jgi:hypothetical protein
MELQKESMLRLLKEIAAMCEEASLTGGLSGGASQVAQRYNSILRHFVAQGAVPDGFFLPLAEDSGYPKIGVESRMLAAFLEENGKSGSHKNKTDSSFLVRLAPFVDSADLAELIQKYTHEGGHFDPGVITALAPFLKSGDLGQIIRKHMDSAIRDRATPSSEPDPTPESKAAKPETHPAPSAPQTPTSRHLATVEDHSPARPSLEELSSQLRRPDISPEERQTIAMQLAEIAHEQARLGSQ